MTSASPSPFTYRLAAQAVVALDRGLEVMSVTVAYGGDEGHVRLRYPPWFHPVKESNVQIDGMIDDQVVALLAGRAAERRLAGPQLAGDESSMHEVRVLAGHRCASDRSRVAYVDWLTIVAGETVEGRWGEIEAVAQVLAERGKLSARQLAIAIQEAA